MISTLSVDGGGGGIVVIFGLTAARSSPCYIIIVDVTVETEQLELL